MDCEKRERSPQELGSNRASASLLKRDRGQPILPLPFHPNRSAKNCDRLTKGPERLRLDSPHVRHQTRTRRRTGLRRRGFTGCN